ncbi:hypothetical protein C5Y96_03690 [Blastopirellula marina]|uniref:Uncharacterized protein n=1 Tax=Blastopirellula marina TaxID=124 RepID=A0A2S8G3G3_9BACT|nr:MULTISPECIES: hypothetical protein [Pirellulaceae]PQO38985.1 hypothetical protein C5Y96_03690 [Blastopirellula marina]RCS55293.1 hypothetical protein DTL36_03695 [Bremerella cremea]
MSLTPAQQKKIRNLYESHTLEVSDLVKIALARSKSDATFLQALRAEYAWPDDELEAGDHVIPWGRWCEVACRYIHGGPAALGKLGTDAKTCLDYFDYCVSFLSSIQTKESVAAVCQIAEATPPQCAKQIERPTLQLAEAFNLLLCIKGAPKISKATEKRVRDYLHRQFDQELETVERASVFDALRGVGDKTSLELLEQAEDLPEPFEDERMDAVKAIKKRIAAKK